MITDLLGTSTPADSDPHREACRRQHRLLAHYLAIQAWIEKLDGFMVKREVLECLLGLQHFKKARLHWLIEDIKPWFEYHNNYYQSQTNAFRSLCISRQQLHLPTGSMTPDDRLHLMYMEASNPDSPNFRHCPQLRVLSTPTPHWHEIVGYLAVLADGLILPQPDELSRTDINRIQRQFRDWPKEQRPSQLSRPIKSALKNLR